MNKGNPQQGFTQVKSQRADGPSCLWHLLNNILKNNPLTLAAIVLVQH